MSADLVRLAEEVERAPGIHQRIADDVPAIKRGLVYCRICGAIQRVDGAFCLRSGWRRCCGSTMTIDIDAIHFTQPLPPPPREGE